MTGFAKLRPVARIYIGIVVVAGAAAVAESWHELYLRPLPLQWLILAALTLLTGFFTVKVPAINARISVSETFVFASVLLFGAAAGTLTVLLESLVILFWMPPGGRKAHRLVFNMAAPSIAIWVSGNVFFFSSQLAPYATRPSPLPVLFLPLAAFTALYFLLNSWLVAIAVGLENRSSAYEVWSKNFVWLSVNYFSGASVAALIVTYTRELDISTLAVIVPLLVVSYLTFKTAMDRVEDTNKHLSELNQLHLSTIETLAMAIDAKDQITHGHIRRVQSYAVALAHRLGVAEEKLIRAIEAASLLHDMGKLAVPEYILNKPGKLTAAEFEKMKLHASVGADILSAIAFPYPVVPIVRHHHENWDGSGYPDGLKGTDIPIGARILSIVDCFDALTSDRPYRPKLSDDDAIAILIERRGSMYDPLIVDTFIKVHKDIDPTLYSPNLQRRALSHIAGRPALSDDNSVQPLDNISASADEASCLYELSRALTGKSDLSEVCDVLTSHLRRLIPSTLSVFFAFDAVADELDARYASGDGAALVRGMRIRRGERLSGWVAANAQTIANSDPVLDLGDVARAHALNLRSCLSTAITEGDHLIGVLTLYTVDPNAFNDNHRRIAEAVSRQLAQTLSRSLQQRRSAHRDSLTGLPNSVELEQFIESLRKERRPSSNFVLLWIDVVGLKHVNSSYGRDVGDLVLQHVGQLARSCIRSDDVLFRYHEDEFIIVVQDGDRAAASAIASRIRGFSSSIPIGSSAEKLWPRITTVILTLNPAGEPWQSLVLAAKTQSHDSSAGDSHIVH